MRPRVRVASSACGDGRTAAVCAIELILSILWCVVVCRRKRVMMVVD